MLEQWVSGTGTTALDLHPTLPVLRQRVADMYPAKIELLHC